MPNLMKWRGGAKEEEKSAHRQIVGNNLNQGILLHSSGAKTNQSIRRQVFARNW